MHPNFLNVRMPVYVVEFAPAQLIFTLSYKSDRLIFPSDSSWSNKTMSKYIPGNQKHLTLDDLIYIQNELSKGTSFKDIAPIAPLLTNTLTMPGLLTANTGNALRSPAPVSA